MVTAVQWVGNVAHLQEPRWPVSAAATPPVSGHLPARWSPRPVAVIRRRFVRSQFAADLADWGFVVALLVSLVFIATAVDHIREALA